MLLAQVDALEREKAVWLAGEGDRGGESSSGVGLLRHSSYHSLRNKTHHPLSSRAPLLTDGPPDPPATSLHSTGAQGSLDLIAGYDTGPGGSSLIFR